MKKNKKVMNMFMQKEKDSKPEKSMMSDMEIIKDLKERIPIFQKKELNDEQMALQFSSDMKVMTINVGGKNFSTTFETLTSQPGSRISEWFKNEKALPFDSNGNKFIDRDPELFAYVLDYLRSSIYPEQMTNRLRKEFVFYGLPPEAPWGIDTREDKLHHHLRVINDGSVVFKAPFDTYSMCAGNKQFKEGQYSWRIKLVNPKRSFFGVIDWTERTPLTTNSQNYVEFIGIDTEGNFYGIYQESDLGPIDANDVIDFAYDADYQRLIIKVTRGENQSVIETNVKGKKIYPSFLIIDPLAKFKFQNTGLN